MKIQNILNKNCIAVQKEFENKNELLEFIVDLACKTEDVKDRNLALVDVLEREKVLSTGIGKGVALPHAKTKAVDDFVLAVANLKSEIEYDSLDSEPVKLIILLLGPDGNIGMNLKILSKISRLLNTDEFRYKVSNSDNIDDIYNAFTELD